MESRPRVAPKGTACSGPGSPFLIPATGCRGRTCAEKLLGGSKSSQSAGASLQGRAGARQTTLRELAPCVPARAKPLGLQPFVLGTSGVWTWLGCEKHPGAAPALGRWQDQSPPAPRAAREPSLGEKVLENPTALSVKSIRMLEAPRTWLCGEPAAVQNPLQPAAAPHVPPGSCCSARARLFISKLGFRQSNS